MHIQINTDDLTDRDRSILLAIAGVLSETPSGVLASPPFRFASSAEMDAEDTAPAAPKKRAPRKPKVVEPKEEMAASEEKIETARAYTEEEEQAALDEAHRQAAEEPRETPTLDEVANVATAFIRNGKRDEIAKILNEDLGVEKVTALKDSPEKVPELLDLLVNFYNVQNPTSRKAIRQQVNEDTAPLFLARTEA